MCRGSFKANKSSKRYLVSSVWPMGQLFIFFCFLGFFKMSEMTTVPNVSILIEEKWRSFVNTFFRFIRICRLLRPIVEHLHYLENYSVKILLVMYCNTVLSSILGRGCFEKFQQKYLKNTRGWVLFLKKLKNLIEEGS